MDFLIDRISDEKMEFELILCKPNGEQVASLKEKLNFHYESQFPTTDEITFDIPYYITKHGMKTKNPNFDLIKGDYLVLVNRKQGDTVLNSKYFIIDTLKENLDEVEMKSIHAYSREYELNKKNIRGYNLTSRQLYSINNEIDAEGYQRGVMNYIMTLTSWTIDIPSFSRPEIVNKFRSFDISEQTVFHFLIEEVQQAFGVIFIFDTINKKIYAKTLEELSTNRGLYISDNNYLKTIIKEPKHDEVVTRLICEGKDGISINSVNPTGTNYIEMFDFYKTTDYMTQGLIDALNAYENLLKYHEDNKTFENLLNQLDQLQQEKILLEGELDNLINGYYSGATLIDGLKQIQDKIDSRIKQGLDYSDLNTLEHNKELEILNKQAQIDHNIIDPDIRRKHPSFNPSGIVSKQSQIDDKIQEIKSFNDLIKKENNFTHEQLVELDYYTREKVWSDSSYETAEELYEEAQKQIVKLAQPPVQFEIDVVDFLQIAEGKADRRKLVLGDLVTIYYEKFGIDVVVRLVGFTYNPDSHELKLKFSNKASIDDPYLQLVELQRNAVTTSTTLDMSKYKWDKSEVNQSQIEQILTRDLEAQNNRVISGKDQEQIIDRRGIWLYSKDSQGNIEPEQIRIVSNSIVLSKDGFKSASTAISPEGIWASQFIGRAIIGAQGVFEGVDIYNSDGEGATLLATLGKYTDSQGNPNRGLYIRNGAINVQNSSGASFITGDSVTVASAGMTSLDTGNNAVRIYAGATLDNRNVAPFRVTNGGYLYAQNATISGTVEAQTMRIRGGNYQAINVVNDPTLGQNQIEGDFIVGSGVNQAGISGVGTSGSSIRFWAGSTNRNSAPFRVQQDGKVYASNIDIVGGSINVATDVTIGNKLHINPDNFGNGIRWGYSYGNPEIYIDPSTRAMFLKANTIRLENETVVESDFSVLGSKNAVVKTSDGFVNVSAYETAEYYFGDIGEGQVIDGECEIFIDKLFKEIVNTTNHYHVFITPYEKGNIYVDYRDKDKFIVKGDDIKFGYEIKAKRKGYENYRLQLNEAMNKLHTKQE